MAKKKKKKEEKTSFAYTNELTGLLLILVGIVGFGDFGIVGNFVKNFAIFLCGQFYFILLILALILGIYMVAKRKTPKFLTAKLVGVYILFLAVLMLAHQNYIPETVNFAEVVKATFNTVTLSFRDSSIVLGNESIMQTGGGMIGCIVATASAVLFGKTGTYVVIVILALFGIVMLFNVTLADMFGFVFKPFKRKKKDKKNAPLISLPDDGEDEEEVNITTDLPVTEKKTISSITELETNAVVKQPTETPAQVGMEFVRPEPIIHDGNAVYNLPSINLLDPIKSKGKMNSTEFISSNNAILERVFADFGIEGRVVQVSVGPTVTQYEMELKAGTRVNRVLSIDKEIALALGAKDVRIEAPIPGKHTIGIEIPNPEISSVQIKEILTKVPEKYKDSKLLAALGKDIMGNIQFVEINKTPHLLVAGATGSGKSVCMNSIITSIIMRSTPEEVRLVLVDPKKVEMAVYEGIPHLLMPVVTNPKKASAALQRIVQEMEDRYDLFSRTGTKNIASYNALMEKKIKDGENVQKLPFIVVIIDELADLMVVAQKEVEGSIMRIAQLARAAGIHLIVATQRPSTNIITGVIKANIPSRISFAVTSQIDSRTILDAKGAEKLLGKGDMLFSPMGENTPKRIQGCFISDEEVERITNFWKRQCSAQYDESFTNLETQEENKANIEGKMSGGSDEDPLYNQVLEFAVRTGKISASLIQRKFSVGYNRAARLVDILEEKGIIGPQNGSKPREVLVQLENNNEEEEM